MEPIARVADDQHSSTADVDDIAARPAFGWRGLGNAEPLQHDLAEARVSERTAPKGRPIDRSSISSTATR